MKLLSSFLAALVAVICSSCSSEQTAEPPEADQGSDASAATSTTLENLTPVEANRNGGLNTTAITPMDVTKGRPAAPTSSTSSEPATAVSSSPPPGLPKILGDGESTLRMVRSGKAGPGEGPRGPDGKVIDPQTYLKQFQEKQAQEAAKKAPQPPSRPPQARTSRPATPPIKRLDPSEAPKLPGASATEKADD